MKINYFPFIIISLLFAGAANCQHQLYFENFEGATNTFTINDNELGTNRGNNKWIVDTNYFGGGIYPNTINEDSTYGGSISYAPYSHYLHIYDSASGYLNDNYNPDDSSTRFAHMTTGICTKSLTDIYFNFYYLCQGSATAYGEVYYSIDGGLWTQIGGVYNSKYKWQYASITSPAFTNVEDLRFGFLWHNNSTTGKDTSAFGVDDVSMYGIYDSAAHPITCTFTTLGFDSCLGGDEYVFFSAVLNDSTCDATWDAYMSKGDGDFPGPYAWYQAIGPDYDNDTISYWYLEFPINFNTVGECYKFKLERTSYPYLTFLDSVCFPFDSCPGTISTLQPPATLDTNPVCAGSIIDIPFISTGIYDTYNTYYAQLIDSVGTTAKIDTIGTLSSNVAYPEPYTPYGPGDIVSTIPLTAPAGCRYYVQVVSNTGNRKPTAYGPFCIQHCEIKTNDQQHVQVCLGSCAKQPKGYSDTLVYADSLDHYYTGNEFEVQLISFMLYPPSFAAVNTGLLGVNADTANGHFKLLIHVPCPDTLTMYGITPGVYYARIVADSSDYPDSSLGSLIQLTIGEPADSMYLTVTSTPPGPPYCAGSTLTFTTNPDDQYTINSTYTWWETDKTNGTVEFAGVNTGYLGLNATADTFLISCQENNYGCPGNLATYPDTIIVIGPPNITKTGPTSLCVGDTGTYSIPFSNNTNYSWEIPAGAHADTSTNQLKIQFNTTGTVRISVLAFNACFTDSAVWSVDVLSKPVPSISVVPSSAFCSGTSATLTASNTAAGSGAITYTWSNGKRTASITVAPTTDSTFWVKVANPGCSTYDTVNLTVIPTPTVTANPSALAVCSGDTVNLSASGAVTYIWSPGTGLLTTAGSTIKAVVTSSQIYTVTGYASDGCKDSATVSVSPIPASGSVSRATSITQGSSITLTAGGGTTYLWSPSAGLSCDTCPSTFASPSVTTTYSVSITDSNGCLVTDTVTVDVIPVCNIFIPTAFSPDNPANYNTKLYVRGDCISPADFDFKIFDRWGNKVFETTDINGYWDGTYLGQPMNMATFVYYVTGKTDDGASFTRKGNVTLVR